MGPARKLDSVTEYPRELLDFMERYFPQKLTAGAVRPAASGARSAGACFRNNHPSCANF